MDVTRLISLSMVVVAVGGLLIERFWLPREQWQWKGRDYLIALGGMIGQSASSRLLGMGFGALLAWAFPMHSGNLAGIPFWLAFIGIWSVEEFCFYWLHRASHEGPLQRYLWKLHRAHHSGRQFGILLAFRYNVWWPFLRPQTWVASFAVYFGLLPAYLVYLTMTFVIGIYSHIQWRWDLPLYRIGWLRPLIWVIERIVVLPDAHHAHHGLGANGRIRSNYGTSMMLWDVLFGTAWFPHGRQDRVGLNVRNLDTREEMLWPLWRQRRSAAVVADR